MTTANIIRVGERQMVELPAGFEFSAETVTVEKHGESVVLRPVVAKHPFRTFAEIAEYLASKYPDDEFPDPSPRRSSHERAMLEF